jgi:hypothetical protein
MGDKLEKDMEESGHDLFKILSEHMRGGAISITENSGWPASGPVIKHMRVYPKVFGLAAWCENCKWYGSLPLSAVVSLFCESV